MYKLTQSNSIIRLADNASIPKDDDNTDYQAYLIWVETNTPQAADTPSIFTLKQAFILKVDADIDAIYTAVIGNRLIEYQNAAIQAKEFKDALYIGTPGTSISNWAAIEGKTNTWAADAILATAAAWNGAVEQMRNVRLAHKKQAVNVTTLAQLQTVQSSWVATLTAIKTSLGIA